jgi:hypothetical protein
MIEHESGQLDRLGRAQCAAPTEADKMSNWVLLSFDSAWKSVLDWSQLYETYESTVRCASPFDHGLIFVKRLTIGSSLDRSARTGRPARKPY